ncbi:isocitrate lyase/PEP mutase family protein [Salipiger pallidus]|nr:isocitrate lyase/phosphoenolpyruvate mutase family protein [Salipiger pallidus]
MEDQEFPKKCGHTPFRRVIPTSDMQRKIEVASKTRKSDDFLIIARAKAYRDAGADVIFVESPESEAEMVQVAAEVKAPLFANMVNGGRTPLFSAEKLHELGYSIAMHPAVGFLAVAQALKTAYGDLLAHGETTGAVDLYDFAQMNKLLGFEDI